MPFPYQDELPDTQPNRFAKDAKDMWSVAILARPKFRGLGSPKNLIGGVYHIDAVMLRCVSFRRTVRATETRRYLKQVREGDAEGVGETFNHL